ncbi:MAG: ABC transporter ATP-binding protein [Pseudorhodobacter sp. PARRP1]|nr:MAG: ABC transporter ATP-binding protein [Pseudorhodobacter sp. PARRP1]
MDVLRLDEVSFAYGALCVTNKISLTLPKGQALGVIGPNGAGKSTLLDLITGTKRVASGRVYFMGQDITAASPQARSDMGIARSFQIPRPFLGMTVYENVLVGATHGGRRAEAPAQRVALRVLEQTGLMARANEPASKLRLLDRKRLELARALATEPKLLLLDEVAGGLSDMECQSFIALLKEIRDGGTTMIWIEHIVHALIAVVSQLFVLDQGARIAQGQPTQVLADPEVRRVYLGIPA